MYTIVTQRAFAVGGLWMLALDLLPANRTIKLKARGSWGCFGETGPKCGPEGYAALGMPVEHLIMAECPAGALIGKTGGSTVGRKDGTVFPMGSFCVLSPLEKAAPLFVAVNGGWRGGGYTFDEIVLEITDSEQVN